MMMKNILFILLLTLGVYSCKNTSVSDQPETRYEWSYDTLKSDHIVYLDNDSAKTGMKLSFMLVYPSAQMNDTLLAHIKGLFSYAFAGEGYQQTDPVVAFTKFEKKCIEQARAYALDAVDDEQMFGEYYQNISTTIVDTTSVSICALTTSSEYLGGAHGSHSLSYYNIDTRTGKLILKNNLFKSGSTDKVATLIQSELPNLKNSNGEIISLLDEIDTVQPNDNFYFGTEGVVFVYNTYEIAPYSEGVVEVPVAYEKIKDLISADYLPIIEQKQK